MKNDNIPPLETFEIEKSEFKKINRRKFLMWMAGAMAGGAGFYQLYHSPDDGRGMRKPLRNWVDRNDTFWKNNFDPEKRSPSHPTVQRPARVNGNIGILPTIDVNKWRLRVLDRHHPQPLSLSYSEIRSLPSVTETFEFKCIEGWSEVMTFKGVRFSDFMKTFKVGYQDDQQSSMASYASLVTVDEGYYVSMDQKSFSHSQTLLCYEMNGSELNTQHGFPLRLVSSVNYGVKSIKQIGTIAFTDFRPDDYWAEDGYGDYLGL